jgi:Holliday junction resolvase RusA-like endonuclease
MTVLIPNWHPVTLNELLNTHWGQRSKLKRADKQIIAHYFRNHPEATGKRLVFITIILKKGKRAADGDAYFKSAIDALVHARMLIDDNRHWCELHPVQFERGTASRWGTAITLRDVESIRKLPPGYAIGSVSDKRVRSTKRAEARE